MSTTGEAITDTEGRQIMLLPDLDAVSQEAAQRFVGAAKLAMTTNGRFTVALAGGSTPERLYRLLASDTYRDQVPWQSTHIFFGDERMVPPDHAESNYRMARAALLDAVPVPPEQVHRMEGERDPLEAATAYEATLRHVFGLEVGQTPRFDLILLGMGPDGHTASLFPHTKALENFTDLVMANYVAKFETWRLTFTYPVLNGAAQVLFLVGGKDKAVAVHEVLQGAPDREEYPSQGVLPTDGVVTFLLDQAAAANLTAIGEQ